MTEPAGAFAAFDAIGVELEYMLVSSESLDVVPRAPEALRALDGLGPDGPPPNEVILGALGWSNELVCHLLELKNPRPALSLEGLAAQMQGRVAGMNRLLEPMGTRLMPGGMHPWMLPRTQTVLWPYANAEIYSAYDRIFDCRSHGWANLQSQHLNLPFGNEDEFVRLHAAIRLILPILPALAASSPYWEARASGHLDTRIFAYSTHTAAVPSLTGKIVPETTCGIEQYRRDVFEPIFRDLSLLDPPGLLRYEWANARGVIPRFERSALEIRVLDVQECPEADLAIAALVCDAVRYLFEETSASLAAQREAPTDELAKILMGCARDGERTRIDCPQYMELLGYPGTCASASDLWEWLGNRMVGTNSPLRGFWERSLERLLSEGPLARRLLNSAGENPSADDLRRTYAKLCACLAGGYRFTP